MRSKKLWQCDWAETNWKWIKHLWFDAANIDENEFKLTKNVFIFFFDRLLFKFVFCLSANQHLELLINNSNEFLVYKLILIRKNAYFKLNFDDISLFSFLFRIINQGWYSTTTSYIITSYFFALIKWRLNSKNRVCQQMCALKKWRLNFLFY